MDPNNATIIIRKGEPTEVLHEFGAVDVSAVTFAGAIRQGPEPSQVGDLLATFTFDMSDAASGNVLATAPAISDDVPYTETCFQFTADGQTILAGTRVPLLPRII